ncbi:MAG: acyl-CoA carboxylase subunit epsilon [Rhodoglobus sp.]
MTAEVSTGEGTPEGSSVELQVLSRRATPEEIAAATAVVQALLLERADEETARVSAWQRGQRPIRSTLAHGAGVWRNFSG